MNGDVVQGDVAQHELKTRCEYFQAVFDGKKPFEVRKDDRNYQTGDWLMLREWDHGRCEYTGMWLQCYVTYKLAGGAFGVEEGYCVLGLSEWRVAGSTRNNVPAPSG